MRMRTLLLVSTFSAGAAGAVLLGATSTTANAQPGGQLPDLVPAIESVEGCLGVETARTSSGKNVIFAWFQDKDAALRWYHHETHQGAMRAFFPERPDREPLQGVPDDAGPILAIASLTFSGKPAFEEVGMPISQIAIELYQPLTGGIHLGGTFAPEGLQAFVPGVSD